MATSNIVPDGLYPNGLQREKFLPAIALLNRYTRVINVDGGVDYRLRTLQQAALYFHPLTVQAQSELVRHFERLSHGAPQNPVTLTIEGRPVVARSEWEDIVWFEFKAICEGPRSQQDYIVLAKEYHTVLLSEVPILGAAMTMPHGGLFIWSMSFMTEASSLLFQRPNLLFLYIQPAN